MIDLTGKSVFVRTQYEYENLLKMAKSHGFKLTYDLKAEIALPNILFFNRNKIVTKLNSDEIIYEASKIVAYVEKLEESVRLAREFIMNPNGITLTESFLKSLELLADTVESQMEEVK